MNFGDSNKIFGRNDTNDDLLIDDDVPFGTQDAAETMLYGFAHTDKKTKQIEEDIERWKKEKQQQLFGNSFDKESLAPSSETALVRYDPAATAPPPPQRNIVPPSTNKKRKRNDNNDSLSLTTTKRHIHNPYAQKKV